MRLWWQVRKFIAWHMIYSRLKPSIEKQQKQGCTASSLMLMVLFLSTNISQIIFMKSYHRRGVEYIFWQEVVFVKRKPSGV